MSQTLFFSAKQLAALQKMSLPGMATPLTIQHRVVTSDDSGDDVVSFGPVATAKGWMSSKPTPVQVENAGSIVTINSYRLLIPVGTDIQVGDKVTIGGDTYVVSDNTSESTWIGSMRVSMRRLE